MDMKNIIKNENDRKNLIWESLKDIKKNLNNNYSTNSSTFNTARSLLQQISQQQFDSQTSEDENQSYLQQNFLQQEQLANQLLSSQNFNSNDYESHQREDQECAFSKIDTNLLEIPKIIQNINSEEESLDYQNQEVNEFRRIPIDTNKHNILEDNSNEFRKKSKSFNNNTYVSKLENIQKYTDFKENNNTQKNQNDVILTQNESYKKDSYLLNIMQNDQKRDFPGQSRDNFFIKNNQQKVQNQDNEASSFRKQRAPSCNQFQKTSCDNDEYKKKQIKLIENQENQENQENKNELYQNLYKENEDLKNLISKIRKDNHQRIQQIVKEYETKIQQLTDSNNENINQLKNQFQEELVSKEEDIQTMILLYQGEQQKNFQE